MTSDKVQQRNHVADLLIEYVTSVKLKNFPFNRLTLSNEAMAIADFLGYKNFVVSSEWMQKFTESLKISLNSPVQDVFDEKAFYLYQMGKDDFYYNRGESPRCSRATLNILYF